MTLANSTISQRLTDIGRTYVSLFEQTHGFLPVCEKDDKWVSPCELTAFDENHNHWKPVQADANLNFLNVETALDIALHPSIKEYFSVLYSESISASCEDGKLSLLFAWSKDDFSRLQENIIGHILMKQRLKQSLTIFFAITDDDDFILSLNNNTGEIWVERVGMEPHKKIAESMMEFLNLITIEAPIAQPEQ